MWAYVWEFDAATAAFNSSPLLQEPLNFNRGINGDGKNETWKPWTNTFQGYVTTGTQPADSRYYYYAQPMLTGIEFDNDGTMILGFRDRFGDQSGYDQPPLTGVGTGFNGGSPNLSLAIDGIATGDILRVFRNPTGCVFVMETNGSSGSITTTGANNGQGPSNYTTNNGEFYYQDGIERFNGGAGDPALWHLNCGEGALAFLPGDQDVASTKIDPMSLFSNGISKMRNTNGTNPADYELFGGTARNVLGKSNGLGDLEILLPLAPIEIGNRIWNDADGDGIQEPGEAGLANITLELFLDANSDGVPDGAAIGTVTTDATGNYYFTSASGTDVTGIDYGVSLVPNQNYIIRVASSDWNSVTGAGIVDLAGLQLTKTDKVGTGAVDLSDNDASLTSGATIVPQIRITTGNAGQNNHNIDFGFKALASLGDKVWRDDNANGIQDAGEPGVAGVTVTLYNNAGAVISTTVTDAYGNYLFDNLAAGTYQVGFTPPTNYNFTTQTNNTDNTVLTGGSTAANGSDVNASGRTANVVLVAGENERNIDAGLIFTQPATNSIGDRVWFDSDGGGTQNGTEPGVSGVTVTLYASDGVTVIATTVTDANGNYLFTGLPASTNYIVGLTPPAGMLLTSTSGTTPGNATVNSDFSTTTFKTTTVNTGIAGTQITGIDAGLIQQAAAKANLGDKVWIDLSGGTANVQDANEPGLPGVTVELLDGSGASIDPDGAGPLTKTEMVTDAFGNYIFNNLNAATYRVKFTLPSGYTFVTQNSGADDFKDSDVNTGTGQTNNYTISAGQRNLSIDAGVTQNSPAGTAKIGDFVWFDANGNGTQDAGETGVAGVTVTLYNNVGTAIATTTTDANGTYQFVNLAAATYSVGFSNLPAGYSFTSSTGTTSGSGTTNSDANTATGKTSNFVLAAGQSLQGLDAGLVAGVSSGLGSLGNKVWWDIVTNNNVQDAGEPGVPGVIVNLDYDINGDGDFLDAGEAGYKSTTTNALGEYLFTGLPAGAYQVRFTNLPTGSSTVTQNSGVNDNIDSDGSAVVSSTGVEVSTTGIYNLAAGEDNLSVDLGIINAAKGSLGNRVWFDNGAGGGTANDGIQNGTEGGVAGVTVTLVNAAGQTVDRTGTITTTPITTTTDANGYYAFADLTAGVSFAVIFSNPPAGFDFTIKSGIGGADDNRSDPNLTSGLTPAVTIVANTFNSTLDAGITSPRAALGNYVWLDTNGDGIQDAAEAGVAGVTVTLYRPGFGLDGIASTADDALPVASMITDQNGQYLFTNLVPGTYQVEFSTIPGGLSFTQQNTPGDNGDNTNSDALPVTGNPSVGRTGNIVLTAGEADLTIDAGLFKPRAVIGNFIWADSNSNGLQDAGEPGLSGVIVTLIDAGGNPVVIAVTDANGGYLFPNVAPGTYSLSFTNLPTGVIFTTSNVGGNDNIDSDVIGTTITGIVVTPTTVNLTYDAGVIGAITLPARLQFTALKQTNAARLIWKVTQEDNVARYELEHSTDGINYVTINNQNRNGSTEYQYLDAQPAQAINFYRVRIIDNNGRVTYSEIRTIVFGKDSQILVFPNPVASGNVNIQLPDSWQNKKITINVMNQLGQIISSRNSQQASQVETVDVSKLSNGSYLLRMSNENGEVEIRKIMVNR